MELTVSVVADALAAQDGPRPPTRSEAHQERLDGLLVRLAHALDDIGDDAPLPISAEQVNRIALAMQAFPALRRHRYVAHRLGLELRPLAGP